MLVRKTINVGQNLSKRNKQNETEKTQQQQKQEKKEEDERTNTQAKWEKNQLFWKKIKKAATTILIITIV